MRTDKGPFFSLWHSLLMTTIQLKGMPITQCCFGERSNSCWLPGGPGMPSSGYGNFVEIGPLDINYQRKNYTLAEDFNVLFIDNPVGVGYSYVEDNSTQLPKNNKEIADDLMRFFEMFIKKRPEFSNTSLYIFGESYGGKMAVEFAYQIMKVIIN